MHTPTRCPRRPFARPLSLMLALGTFAPLGACLGADADQATGEAAESLSSNTKTFLVPVDERVRHLCHEEINRHYCTRAAAQRATTACLARIGADVSSDPCAAKGSPSSPGCLRYETIFEACLGTARVYPTLASCKTPRARSCHFYSACLEPSQPCGDEGYALGYGERYCYAFKNAHFSAKGDAWRDGVMLCLQKELVTRMASEEPPVCREIEDFAFASHPECYTQPGRSICFLPPSDLAGVFSTIGLEEALDGRTQSQIRRVVATCVGQTARRLFGREAPRSASGAPTAARGVDLQHDLATDEEMSTEALHESQAFWAAKANTLGLAH